MKEPLRFVVLPQLSVSHSGEGGTSAFRLFPGHLGLGRFLDVRSETIFRGQSSPCTEIVAWLKIDPCAKLDSRKCFLAFTPWG